MYDAVQERISAYEQEILRKLGEMEREEQRGQTAPALNNTNKAKAIKKRSCRDWPSAAVATPLSQDPGFGGIKTRTAVASGALAE